MADPYIVKYWGYIFYGGIALITLLVLIIIIMAFRRSNRRSEMSRSYDRLGGGGNVTPFSGGHVGEAMANPRTGGGRAGAAIAGAAAGLAVGGLAGAALSGGLNRGHGTDSGGSGGSGPWSKSDTLKIEDEDDGIKRKFDPPSYDPDPTPSYDDGGGYTSSGDDE